MASINSVYPDKWLKAEDLKGAQRRVRVKSVTIQEFRNTDGSKENKAVISFVDKEKQLICNKGQAKRFGQLLGDDYETWGGREVFLTPVPAPNGKEMIAITAVVDEKQAEERIPF